MKKLYNSMRSQKAAKLAGAFIFTLLMVQPQTPAYAVNNSIGDDIAGFGNWYGFQEPVGMTLPDQMYQENGKVERDVPILSNIPYIGRLFRNTAVNRDRANFIIFITPRILITED